MAAGYRHLQEKKQQQEKKVRVYRLRYGTGGLPFSRRKVSSAMLNHELPFVIMSSVYENPYRLHVTVISNSESDLQKLKEMDTLGGVLEIEYVTDNRFVKY